MWLLRRILYSGDQRFFSSYGRWMTQGVWLFCVTSWNINVSNRSFLFKPRSKKTTDLVNIMKFFYAVATWDVHFGNFKLRNLLHNTVLVLTSINICCHRINVLIFICRKKRIRNAQIIHAGLGTDETRLNFYPVIAPSSWYSLLLVENEEEVLKPSCYLRWLV